jgi:hypothetical protein
MLFLLDIQQVDLPIVEAERALDETFAFLDSSHQQMLSSLTVAYQSFVAVQQCLTRLHELRAQRTRLSPMVASSEHTRYDLFLFGKNSRPTGLVMMMLNLFVALMTF